MQVAINGTRSYTYVFSGYETFAKELSERLVKASHNGKPTPMPEQIPEIFESHQINTILLKNDFIEIHTLKSNASIDPYLYFKNPLLFPKKSLYEESD